jgi:hypothetical protein
MVEHQDDTAPESDPQIRIERLNSDKTRKAIGSNSVYHVYFELSGHPPPEWRSIFGREWKSLNLTRVADIDGAFLVLYCPLDEVPTTQFAALKKAVAATNEAYKRYAQNELAALEHRQDLWKQERDAVDAMASSLRFD